MLTKTLWKERSRMLGYVVAFVVTAVIFLVMIRVSIGLDADSRQSALWAALVFGLFNAALHPLMGVLPIPNTLITFFLLAVVVNAIVLLLTSTIIKGFRVNGCVNALIASVALGVLNTLLYGILGFVGV